MAARKKRGTVDSPWEKSIRDKIKTSMLVNAVINHVPRNKNMVSTQIRAAEILLKKVLPDLSSIEAVVETAVKNPSALPCPDTYEEWLKYVEHTQRPAHCDGCGVKLNPSR